jgi:tetratricopeptide (TPR) repeat protein
MADPVRVLALVSDPLLDPGGRPVARLSLDKEVEHIRRQLACLNRAAELRLLIATPDNLLTILRDHGPFDVIHFTGHGNNGELAFEDGRAGALPVDPMRLQALFTPLGQPPCRVAFLSACHSESMAAALLAAGAPHVVAVDGDMAVFDVAARAFAGQFYPALLGGKSVRQAFEFGRAAVLTDPDTLTACRIQAERKPELAALVSLLAGQEILPADALNRLEMLKFKLLPGPAGEAPDPQAAAPFADAPAGELTLVELPSYPETLGASLASFTGRATELHTLIHYSLERPLTAIVGTGGMGKSELAREVGRWFARRGFFRGGITLIHLGDRANAAEARLTIAAELHLEPACAESDRSLARSLPPDSLLILDELDRLCAEDLRATRRLFEALRDQTQARILTTTRQATGVSGEQRFPLKRLAPPADGRLFLTLAHDEVGDDLQGGPAELEQVLQFLDGYPRAIVQAARQLKFNPSLALLVADLKEAREEILQDPDLPPGDLHDHESVLVTLNSSFNRLQARNPEAAAFFALLSLFPAGLGEAGLTAIFGPAARRRLQPIIDLSLVEIVPPLNYYYLPAPVRSFAERQLPPTGPDQYGPAALDYYADTAEMVDRLLTSGQLELGVMLTTLELPNLYFWLDWGFEREQISGDGRCQTARIMGSLGNYYTMVPLRRGEARARYERALASATRLQDRAGQANTLKSLGDLALRLADLGQAAQRYEAALRLFTEIDAKLGQANTLLSQAKVFDAEGDLERALKNFERALALYHSFNDTYSLAVGLGSLGELWLRHAQPEAAYRAWGQRLILITGLQPVLFTQMSSRTINQAKQHALTQPGQAAAGCAALRAELQPALAEANRGQDPQAGAWLGLAAAVFQAIGLAGLAAEQSRAEQAETLARARQLAVSVDEATDRAFELAAWLEAMRASFGQAGAL